MAKRKARTARTSSTRTAKPGTRAVDTAMQQRVVAFAEQLGRFAGTVQVKAEDWVDLEALNKQIAGVRESAADMLKKLASRKTSTAKQKRAGARGQANPAVAKGRSGGVVDAPGKKHRKPLPPGPEASRAESQAGKIRAAKTMVKTAKHRGRG